MLSAMLFSVAGCSKTAADESESTNSGPKLTYATEGVTVVDDQDSFQAMVDEMVKKAAEGTISLDYKTDAHSNDGQTFSCYLANSESNNYDMFISIYADQELTDELYLSGLLRPGTAFNTLTLNKKLDSGSHTVYVAHTQVEEDLETIHAQVVITMNFTVA